MKLAEGKCPNKNCISNHEPMKGRLVVLNEKPLTVRCHYCERTFRGHEIQKS